MLAAQGARAAEAAAGALGVDVSMALPTVVANLHDYFTHVAAKLERIHGEVRFKVHGDMRGWPGPLLGRFCLLMWPQRR